MADKKAPQDDPSEEEEERDEDEGEEDDSEEEESEDEAPKKAEAEEDDSEEEESEDEAPKKAEADGDGDGEQQPDESAARVAEALGIDEEGSTKPAGTEEPVEEAAPNRAARRREEARERRRKRKAAEVQAAAPRKAVEDEDLPRDKNARAKELLLRRREQAKGGGRPSVQSALLPGEMVDDALARTASAFSKWFRTNWNTIQWAIVVAIVGGGGTLFYLSQKDKKAGTASSTLASAVLAERGHIMPEDKRTDEEKEADTARIFKTPEERADTALAAYTRVVSDYPGTGTAILATMGEAGVYLDKKDYEKALERYSSVIASTLAAADPDVKGRAIEGVALAKEGKGDIDGALKSFKELESVDAKGYKELALYHQARLLLGKGDKDKAKELLKQAREKLTAPGVDGHPFQFLEAVVDESLRKIDPTAVPAKTSLSGPKGTQMSPEELEKLIKKARDAAEKKNAESPEPHDEH